MYMQALPRGNIKGSSQKYNFKRSTSVCIMQEKSVNHISFRHFQIDVIN